MTDLICRKTMQRCQHPGMCSPHGGCQPDVEINSGHVDLGEFVDWVWALKSERDQLKAENAALRQKADCVDDCAHLIRKLVHCRRQLNADEGLAEKALDYLKRKGLQGSPLRAEEASHD